MHNPNVFFRLWRAFDELLKELASRGFERDIANPLGLCWNPGMNFAATFIATFFYVGRSPKAPGTMGSLAALPLAWWVWKLPSHYAWAIIVALFLLGVWSAGIVIRRTGKEDHQTIVMDEVVGILVTTSVAANLWWHYALAFLFFRAIDIFKPGPVAWLDRRVKGGLGAMTDDLAAAIIATCLLYITLYFSGAMVAPAVA